MKHTQKTKQTSFFIMAAHSGQEYGNDPYWTHPLGVAAFGQEFFGEEFDEDAALAALMHDVIEDTNHTRKTLSYLGYSDTVLDCVELVTKDGMLSYFENIQRIIDSGNRRAMMVKFADNYKNFTGDKSDWETKKREKAQAKYMKSMLMLAEALEIELPTDIS
jgi:guanosine-3',5'-bis(diphosphate) 3'-pyrophosphohydrolase